MNKGHYIFDRYYMILERSLYSAGMCRPEIQAL